MIRGGRSLVSAAPAFSNDGKKLLVCTDSSVSIFSTATALQISSLEGHNALVTAVQVVPSPSKVLCYCWTASLDGTIRYWDYSVPELVKTIDIGFPIFSMVIPSLSGKPMGSDDAQADLFAYLSVENLNAQPKRDPPKALCGQIRRCNLTKSRLDAGLTMVETTKPESITVSPSGKFFGIQMKRKFYIWSVPHRDSDRAVPKKTILHHTKSFTALAFHPTKRIVAAGDASGRILIWRGFGSRTFLEGDRKMNGHLMDTEDDRPGVRGSDDADSCSTWHWHSAEVMVLHFSADGAYLYSGGREAVLVLWQLDTGNKKFLPRLGSPLLYFKDSPDPSLTCVSCADNQIHLLKMPSLEISKSISGIKLPYLLPETYEGFYSGPTFVQAAGLVALPTENYGIQFYDLFDDRGVREVQVCERNHQPDDDVTVVITLVALSFDGSTMSTVEAMLPEEGVGGLICLKFWALGSLIRECTLSTIIYEPHREADITSVAFHPTRLMAATSSNGGDFKIWICNHGIQLKDQMLQNSGWTCHAVGSYKKKPLTAASFSADGSVLVVAAETVITLWDPHKNVLVAVIGETLTVNENAPSAGLQLVAGEHDTPIAALSFAGNSEYLVCASQGSKPQLSVWDLSKLSMHWSYRLHAEALACAVDASSFAVLTLRPISSLGVESYDALFQGRDGLILLFKVKKPVPVATWSVRKAIGGRLGFIKGNLDNKTSDENSPSQLLVYINADHEYVIFDPYSKETHEQSVTHQDSQSGIQETAELGYASIYGELPVFDQKRIEASTAPSVPSERPWESIFSGSSHNLPPLTKLCSAFLESLLEKRTPVTE